MAGKCSREKMQNAETCIFRFLYDHFMSCLLVKQKWTAKKLGFNVAEAYAVNGGLLQTKLQRNISKSRGLAR